MKYGMVHVVDDDDAVRDSLVALLRTAGFNVLAHAGGEDFLRHYNPEQTLCVLLDVRMPGMDGITLHEKMMVSSDAPPVIIITGHGDVAMAVQAMKRGAFDFVEKPFEAEVLVQRVEAAAKWREITCRERARVADANKRLDSLTPRERDVLRQLLLGRSNKAIARELGLSPRTVEVHRARIMEKTGAQGLSQLVRMAIAAGLESEVSWEPGETNSHT